MDEALALEMLDDSEEHESWALVQESIAVLDTYYDDISKTGGISRDQAKALVQQCGVQMGASYPPESFTQMPSRTNYTVAMESMLEESLRLVWTLVKKASELLLKIVRWVIDMLRQHRDRTKQTQRSAKNAKVIADANQQLREAGVANTVTQNKNVQSVMNEQAKIDAANERYEAIYTQLAHDIIVSAPNGFTAGLRNVYFEIFEMADVVAQKMELFDMVLNTHPETSNSGANIAAISQLKTIATPLNTANLIQTLRIHGIKVKVGESLYGCMVAFSNQFNRLRSTPADEMYDPIDAIDIAASNQSTAPYSPKPEHDTEVLRRLEKELNKIKSISPSNTSTPEIRNAFNSAVNCLISEVNAVKSFMGVFRGCEIARQQLFDLISNLQVMNLMIFREAAKVADDPAVIEKINAAQRYIRDNAER